MNRRESDLNLEGRIDSIRLEEKKRTFRDVRRVNHLNAFVHPEFLRDQIVLRRLVADDSLQNGARAVERGQFVLVFADENVQDEDSKDFRVLKRRRNVSFEGKFRLDFTSGERRAPITSTSVWAMSS